MSTTRIFAQFNVITQQEEWFFNAREGLEGPFPTEVLAQAELARYLEYLQFDSSRIFPQINDAGVAEWFFVARDGFEGPFSTEGEAKIGLERFIESVKSSSD